MQFNRWEVTYEQKSTSKFILWRICRFGTWGESYVRLHCQQYYADYFFWGDFVRTTLHNII